MFSLVYLIVDYLRRHGIFKENIIQIRRIPTTKTLRAHIWGLTLGITLFFLAYCFDYAAIFRNNPLLPWFTPIVFLVACALGTYFGGIFFIIIAIFYLLRYLVPIPLPAESPKTFYAVTQFFAAWYMFGYLLGSIFATLYNDLLYLHLLSFGKKSCKIAFAYDITKELNIIKSPYERDETALLEVLKPIMYYAKNIENREATVANVKNVVGLIRKAYCYMTYNEQQALKEILSDKPDEAGKADKNPTPQKDDCKHGQPQDMKVRDLLNTLQSQLTDPDDAEVQKALQRVLQAEPLVEKYLQLKWQKLYNYRLETLPECPYTIAFVANPFIRKRRTPPEQKTDQGKDVFVLDPIIADRDLFLRYVNHALASFDRNEVLGRPEIWSRVRIITIFDENLANKVPQDSGPKWGLLEEFQLDVEQDNLEINNILDCRREMLDNFDRMLNSYQPNSPNEIKRSDIDVIFALSAHPENDRSMAHFSDWVYYGQPPQKPMSSNKKFSYRQDPDGKKGDEIIDFSPSQGKSAHDYFAALPGRVALNVLSARQRTFVHEFAHAMSSAVHGAIVDEYFDEFYVQDPAFLITAQPHKHKAAKTFYVNRVQRRKKQDGKTVVPVHNVFAEFEGTIFHADMTHPSAEESWLGYFPERADPNTSCTMDRAYGPSRFDRLIARFMYERMIAKLNRLAKDKPKA